LLVVIIGGTKMRLQLRLQKSLPIFFILLILSLLIIGMTGCKLQSKGAAPQADAEPATEEAAGEIEELQPDKETEENAEEPDSVAESAPAEPAEVTPEPVPVAEPEPTPTPEHVAEPEPAGISSADAPVDDQVQDLQARHQKISSYSFYYATSENWNLLRDQYFIKGDHIKVILYEPNQWTKRTYYDTVYLNTKTKTAEAYCESRNPVRCSDKDRKFDVSYDENKIRTPSDWINGLPADAYVVGSEQFDNRPALVLEYQRSDGATVRISVDKFSGTPAFVLVYMGEVENVIERYVFKELSVNSVKSSEVVH
jgi:hypothetical protein